MEDLGVRSCATPFNNCPVEQADFPEELKQYVKVVSALNGQSLLHQDGSLQSCLLQLPAALPGRWLFVCDKASLSECVV